MKVVDVTIPSDRPVTVVPLIIAVVPFTTKFGTVYRPTIAKDLYVWPFSW